MRKIDLGLDLVSSSAAGTRRFAGALRLGGSTEVSPYFLGFVFFEGTGMGFLLRNSNLWKYVKNSLALDFQFPGQIVDSNLAHPPFWSSRPSR